MEQSNTAEQAIQEISEKAGRTLDEAKAIYNTVYDDIEATIKGSAQVMGEHAKKAAVISSMAMHEVPSFVYTKTVAHLTEHFLGRVM
jgi:hypothetical protein